MITDKTLVVTASCPRALAKRAKSWGMNMLSIDRKLASNVYSATLLDDGAPMAVKFYQKRALTALARCQVRREIEIHSNLSHQNVIDMWGAFENDEYYVILMELGKCNLQDLVDMWGASEQLAAKALGHVLSALAYLHQRGIVHRDVKQENVIFAMDGSLKLADFGLAIDLTVEPAVTRAGTLELMAPEVVACPCKACPRDNKGRQDLWYGYKVDTWSCGVMAYELMSGRTLFDCVTVESTMFAITHREIRIPYDMSYNARDFVQRALVKQAQCRPSARWLLGHEFVKKV